MQILTFEAIVSTIVVFRNWLSTITGYLGVYSLLSAARFAAKSMRQLIIEARCRMRSESKFQVFPDTLFCGVSPRCRHKARVTVFSY